MPVSSRTCQYILCLSGVLLTLYTVQPYNLCCLTQHIAHSTPRARTALLISNHSLPTFRLSISPSVICSVLMYYVLFRALNSVGTWTLDCVLCQLRLLSFPFLSFPFHCSLCSVLFSSYLFYFILFLTFICSVLGHLGSYSACVTVRCSIV
jgi:hypothetical protein